MNFNTKLKLFKFIQKILKYFNLKIFYSKDVNFLNYISRVENIIDVGVENGTKFLYKNFPKAKYYLIEANPIFYDYLENKFLKKYNGKLFKIAAGKKKSKKYFFLSGPISSFYKREDFHFKKRKKVDLVPLDIILNKEKINSNTILKVDCEGGELDVLLGAKGILKKVNYVIIELRLQKINTYNPSEIISFLYNFNFKWRQILKVYYAKNGIDYIDILFTK
tara:strand:- start:223 stop:885 length:663 start_codon:yes stop_codon:yes gene_type:complete